VVAAAAVRHGVLFAFWLSHVPSVSFALFWSRVGRCLVAGDRVIFVDEQVGEAAKEASVVGSPALVRRRLADGSRYQIVKVFRGPAELERPLGRLGSARTCPAESWPPRRALRFSDLC
jgi:demethylmenaquinone methyltransferase/2-methoxy-6-polyprenyl-1,4-benzoquinol methylase